ncbi:hypothetical protein FIBSPDRAFT_1055963 [Athelia psychrophila]|uniref:Uncharacterized protein n=1 Tax=Athelia psychrophila TaxID=1759441 RepID=A0A167SVT2_9AGAM|nr:hypothetical protein FIBSPDRAFT_1055963 [Fibularhizoctonia sp. CBS 109695]
MGRRAKHLTSDARKAASCIASKKYASTAHGQETRCIARRAAYHSSHSRKQPSHSSQFEDTPPPHDNGQTQDDGSDVQPKQDDLAGRSPYSSPHVSPRCNFEGLPESATRSDVSPGVIDLTDEISREGQYACAHGGFADVWKGIWLDARGAHVKHVISSHG